MDVELRPITEDEYPAFSRVLQGAFGFHASPENLEEMRSTTEFDRTIGAFEGDDIVATAGAYSFELTLPGGALEPAAGVTYVTVRGTHRRRGLLRAMMDHQLDDVADRGESIAILTASESSIYNRFGYGIASLQASWEIQTAESALAYPSRAPGDLRIARRSEAIPHLPGVYDQRRRSITGAVNRSQAWWDRFFLDREWERNGASARFYVLHESPTGEVDGFVTFRRRRANTHGAMGDTIVVDQLYGLDDEIEATLWQYVLEHDLVAKVEARGAVDLPIRWRLADPRQLACTDVVDSLWLRLVDLPRALSARRYSTDDALVVEVVDSFRPANDGCYLIEGGPEGATAARTDRPADLSMSVVDLGTLYMGAASASTLARAARITEERAGALARADAFFAVSPAAWLTTGF